MSILATMQWLAWMAAAMGATSSATAPDANVVNSVRVATFNIKELKAAKLAQVDAQGRGTHAQLRKAAEIIQRVRPDVLLINEIDYDAPHGRNARLFCDRYLACSQSGQPPIDYPFVFMAPVNTGVATGQDLDQDGRTDGPGDAFGFGHYPGEYGMALLSRAPIQSDAVRRFQHLLWKDMPDNLMPDGSRGKPLYYAGPQTAIFRLSSKSHWVVPLQVVRDVNNLLASHPTPPVFDGPEDRNGRRNHDENRFWADYVSGDRAAEYIVDDSGNHGGLPPGALFIIMGDLNSDPVRMEEHAAYARPPIQRLLMNPRVHDPRPKSLGSAADPRAYPGDKTARTNGFGRIDYVLPCRELGIHDAGVFWPPPGDPLYPLVCEPDPASDHYLVWVDLILPSAVPAATR